MIMIKPEARRKMKNRLLELIAALFMVVGLYRCPVYAAEKKADDHDLKAVILSQNPEKGNMNMQAKETMKHELPPLPYDYNELEPYYDEETLRLHHDKHHAAYVKGLNTAEEKLAEARQKGDNSLIRYWERTMAFNGSGHILHCIFWTNMKPNRTNTVPNPQGELAAQISHDFESFEAFRKQFSAAALDVEGSGWCILGWMPEFRKMVILQAENHQKLTLWGVTPLLVIDVWEHAYYLRYQNRRTEWIENWWYIVNWEDVSQRFTKACK